MVAPGELLLFLFLELVGRFSSFIRAFMRLASVSADMSLNGFGVSDPDGDVTLVSILSVASTKVVWQVTGTILITSNLSPSISKLLNRLDTN